MSRLVSRILLSIFVFPLGGVIYILVFVVSDSSMRQIGYRYTPYREMELFLASGLMTWVAVAAYWIMLWRSGIAWTRGRVTGTFGMALGAATVGTFAGVLAGVAGNEASFGAFIGGVVAILLWLIGTVFLWRETTLERARRVSSSNHNAITCPTCGYNLTGLSEARCPECGSRFTLDELLAAGHSKTEVEIE